MESKKFIKLLSTFNFQLSAMNVASSNFRRAAQLSTLNSERSKE